MPGIEIDPDEPVAAQHPLELRHGRWVSALEGAFGRVYLGDGDGAFDGEDISVCSDHGQWRLRPYIDDDLIAQEHEHQRCHRTTAESAAAASCAPTP